MNDTIVAEQRLKGSCPWVFAWDGTRMTFVTDFLWRSPLGLRINAQDTAGVTQTEDWVRLRGDQLVPRDGFYDVRITAELWETHFFDHVSLLAVDHPDDTEILVDERFSPASPPALAVQAMKDLRPVTRAWDERGVDVTPAVAARDGQYLSTFARGRYQGIAKDHFVEIEPGAIGADSMLVAQRLDLSDGQQHQRRDRAGGHRAARACRSKRRTRTARGESSTATSGSRPGRTRPS